MNCLQLIRVTTYTRKLCRLQKESETSNELVVQQQAWERYVSNTGYDSHGQEWMAYNVVSHLNPSDKHTERLSIIEDGTKRQHYKNIWNQGVKLEEDGGWTK